MAKTTFVSPPAPASDPFLERADRPYRRRILILGQWFHFESNSRRILELVDAAYYGLPRHRLKQLDRPFTLTLDVTKSAPSRAASFPPTLRMHGAGGLLCGVMDSGNYAVLSPSARTGLVVASRELLKYKYDARYQLIEFAVFTLGSRGQGLIPLHAACIGRDGRGLLLIGTSGTGKSTLAMLCAMRGMDFLTEDATFVAPESMLGTGVSNFLHLRKDAIRYIDNRRIASAVRRSPVIRRLSGIEKHEVDVRRIGLALAARPLAIRGIVFVTARHTRDRLLALLSASQSVARLSAAQPYAVAQPGWATFARRIGQIPAYELRRGGEPLQAVDILCNLLESR